MIPTSSTPGRLRAAARFGGLLAAIAWSASAAVAEAPGAGAVLDLAADGFLVGGLVPAPVAAAAPRATLQWRSPLFAEPIEFDVDEIERIRFPRLDVPTPPATHWRVGLRDGSFAIGALEAIDADHVVLAVPGVGDGTLRIRRGAIERISRDSSAGKVIVPGGLDGWDVTRGGWQEQAGRLACDKGGAEAFRDVAAAPRACFDLVLSWDEPPQVEAFFASAGARSKLAASDNKPAAADERYRVEMTAGELLAIREGPKAATLDLVGAIPPGAGGLHLQVFVDQQAGRMAVVLPDRELAGKPVFDETLAPRTSGSRKGFGILLRDGSVRIDGLRVVPWTDPEPRLASSGLDEVLESFDKARGTFTFRGGKGPREVAAAELPMIEFPAAEASGSKPSPGSVMAAFHGGARVSGRIVEITEQGLRLDCPALADPLVCQFGQLAEIEPLTRRAAGPLPGRPGTLEADTGRMLGCLANAPGSAGGIAWQPRGAVKPVPIDADTPLRISYQGIAAPGGVGVAAAGQANVYLKTGDSLTCTVVSADSAGLRIRSDFVGEKVVPAVALRAVELVPGGVAFIPKDKLARLLTLPRMQQADPPLHMLRLSNGDYLRGKLVSLDDQVVRMDVLGVVKSLPRAEVARVIWLSVEGDEAEAQAVAVVMGGPDRGGVPTRATMNDGRRLSLAAERVDGAQLLGKNGVIGTVSVNLALCKHLDLGPRATEALPGELPYSQWKLKPARGPRALEKPEGADAERRAGAAPSANPLAGKPAVVPLLPLLERDAEGRGQLSPVGLEGRIGVLGLVDVSDRAGLDCLPRLAEAVAALEPEGVVCAAIITGGNREKVTREVSGLKPKPPIALDPAGRLRAAWGEPDLPACLLVDGEGRIADVLPLADGGVDKIRTRAAELVAGSRATRREFETLARAKERALAGDRGCLDDLGGLLAAKAEAVRRRSIAQIRQLTGLWDKEMPYLADAPPDVRAEQVRKWRQWLAKEAISAKLTFPKPLDAEWGDRPPITGRTLVCRPGRRDFVELLENGEEGFTVPVQAGWACDVTLQGNRLVGDHVAKSVVEYDADGKEVWSVRNLPGGPMSARRLDSGNTLVALSDANLVAEYDPQGKVVWKVKVEGRPCDARRLPDGTTLVAAHRANRIVELDAAGTETWVVEKIEDPQAAQRLPNGNTVVAMSTPGIVREIDREGRVVWQKEGFNVPVDVQRLPDGHTLVQEQQGDLVELGVDGAEIGRRSTGGSRFLRF
jgi:hypothetical protein